MTKIKNKPKNINFKMNNNPKIKNQPQTQNPANTTTTSILAKDKVLALFPCDGYMDIFDDNENIIKIFQIQYNKTPKDKIISILNYTSFNVEQAYYDLANGT